MSNLTKDLYSQHRTAQDQYTYFFAGCGGFSGGLRGSEDSRVDVHMGDAAARRRRRVVVP